MSKNDDLFNKYVIVQTEYEQGEVRACVPSVVVDNLETAWTYIEQRVYQWYNIANIVEDGFNCMYVRIDVDGVRVAYGINDFMFYKIIRLPYIES